MKRLDWLDTAKGIGITAVVAGHVFSSRLVVDPIYLWHMPLFFFLSGYLFSPRPGVKFLAQKSQHLLVPYLAFLVLFSLPQLPTGDLKYLMSIVLGGRALTGSQGTLWFVPVLFATQQLANLLLPRMRPSAQAAMAVVFVCAASLIGPGQTVPWALDVVLISFPVFWVGTRCKGLEPNRSFVSVLGLAGICLCAAGWLPSLDMKIGIYGWPFVTLAFSLAAVSFICQISHRATFLNRPFQALGRASMTIMFVHPATAILLRDKLKLVDNEAILFLIALIVPLALHHVLSRTALTRRLFLGETPSSSADPASSLQVQNRQSS